MRCVFLLNACKEGVLVKSDDALIVYFLKLDGGTRLHRL